MELSLAAVNNNFNHISLLNSRQILDSYLPVLDASILSVKVANVSHTAVDLCEVAVSAFTHLKLQRNAAIKGNFFKCLRTSK